MCGFDICGGVGLEICDVKKGGVLWTWARISAILQLTSKSSNIPMVWAERSA